VNLKPGDTIPLKFQLTDQAVNKFPRAVVRDANDAPISGSPFTLAHVANGLYTNALAVAPDTKNLSVQYLVYSDAGHTTLDTGYEAVTIEIPVAKEAPSASSEITGVVDESAITGVVEDNGDGVISGIVCDCEE